MRAGTIAKFEAPTDAPIESYNDGGFRTIDVRESQSGLGGDGIVQSGAVCATVEATEDSIGVSGTNIEVETVSSNRRTATEWVADPTGAGFIVAASTDSGEPPFPFDVFQARLGVRVDPVVIDVGSVISGLADAYDGETEVWMDGRKSESAVETEPDNVSISYGRKATLESARRAEIGVGFETGWRANYIKGVIYQSGYLAVWEESWGPVQFARFVADAVLPHAWVPEPEEEGEQSTLGATGEGVV